MINDLFGMQEKMLRKASISGNGAHVFVPKEWVNEEVLVVRMSKLDIKKEILNALEPYTENIICAILFGSYARKEQNEQSDVDILVISDKPLKIKKNGFDIVVISEEKLQKAKELNPILYYSAILEGKPILNSSYLNKLRKENTNFKLFKGYYKSTKASLESSSEILQLDKGQNQRYVSNSVIYSLFLRLRGLFIIDCLSKKETYSNAEFRKWLSGKIQGLDYESFYSVYSSVRDDKKTTCKVNIKVGESLINLLRIETGKND